MWFQLLLASSGEVDKTFNFGIEDENYTGGQTLLEFLGKQRSGLIAYSHTHVSSWERTTIELPESAKVLK